MFDLEAHLSRPLARTAHHPLAAGAAGRDRKGGGVMYYIVDLRPEWRRKWAVSFWRPNNCGYCFPLSWAGRYNRQAVMNGGSYYTTKSGRHLIRFAAPCDLVDALAAPPPSGRIDGDAGPVVFNTPEMRAKLRKAALAIEATNA